MKRCPSCLPGKSRVRWEGAGMNLRVQGSEEKQEGKKGGDSQSGLESAVFKSMTLGYYYLLEK